MAKIFGLNGNISGRQGNNVFAILKGETILRKYQPIVANPNTTSQVAARAKFKEISQFGSIIPVRAITGLSKLAKQKNVTLRNSFSSLNILEGNVNYENNVASIDYTKVQFSDGHVALDSLHPDFQESQEVDLQFVSQEAAVNPSLYTCVAVVFCPALKQFVVNDTPVPYATASTNGIILPVSANWAGAKVRVWGYMVKAESVDALVRYSSAFASSDFSVTAELVQAASQMSFSRSVYAGEGTIS